MSSLNRLYNQKNTITSNIASTKNVISSLEDKISRLERASSDLDVSISNVKSIQGSISRLTIDTGRWKGEEENKFEEAYGDYVQSVKEYVSKVEDAKDAIDADKSRYLSQKVGFLSQLSHLENSLRSIDRQIIQAQE